MKKLLLLICLISSAWMRGQKITAEFIGAIPLKTTEGIFLGFDSLGAYYRIEQQVLIKQNGSQVWQYKNLQLGKISRVDLLNPLQIVVYFEAQNTVTLLDAQLNETQKINFNEKMPELFPSAVGLASGNRLWLLNSLNQRIGLYDFKQNKWQVLGIPLTAAPMHPHSDYNYFFWSNAQDELYRIDVFGKVTFLGRLPQNEGFVWADEQTILYQFEGQLFRYNFNDHKRYFVEIDKKSFKNFTYKDQILSIFTDQGISNYKINLP